MSKKIKGKFVLVEDNKNLEGKKVIIEVESEDIKKTKIVKPTNPPKNKKPSKYEVLMEKITNMEQQMLLFFTRQEEFNKRQEEFNKKVEKRLDKIEDILKRNNLK